MGQALLFGLIGSSALVIGGAIGAYWRAPHQISGVLLAFASGTLISALAFELFPEAVHLGGLWPAGLGLIAGGLTFVVINTLLDSWVARSAGDPHEVPALSAEAAEELRARGMPLGLMPGMGYEEKQTILEAGEAALLYSDGLVEAHDPEGEMFGFPRLRALVAEHGEQSSLGDFLLEELYSFVGESWEQEDDITLLTLRCSPYR
jgi:hypothetical protein